MYNCLTLTGEAVFEDFENHQQMRADRLKVWLEPGEAGKLTSGEAPKLGASTTGNAADDKQRSLRPHQVEAKGHVSADSPDMHVKPPTESLVIYFKDGIIKKEPGTGDSGFLSTRSRTPAASPAKTGPGTTARPESLPPVLPTPANAQPPQALAQVPTPATGTNSSGQPGTAVVPDKTKPAEKPKKPIDLNAHSVTVKVIRDGTKSELDQLNCDGNVHVHQDPATAEEKGMDITGDALQLDAGPKAASSS